MARSSTRETGETSTRKARRGRPPRVSLKGGDLARGGDPRGLGHAGMRGVGAVVVSLLVAAAQLFSMLGWFAATPATALADGAIVVPASWTGDELPQVGGTVQMRSNPDATGTFYIKYYDDDTGQQLPKEIGDYSDNELDHGYATTDGLTSWCIDITQGFTEGPHPVKDMVAWLGQEGTTAAGLVNLYVNHVQTIATTAKDKAILSQVLMWETVFPYWHGRGTGPAGRMLQSADRIRVDITGGTTVSASQITQIRAGARAFVAENKGRYRGYGVIFDKGGSQVLAVPRVVPVTGRLSLAKVSANEALTAGNDAYDLAGAWFHVYKDDGDWSQAGLDANSVGWLVTGAQEQKWGRTVAIAHDYYNADNDYLELPAGTYWVREEWTEDGAGAPRGYALGKLSDHQNAGYRCGPWVKVEVLPGETVWVDSGASDALEGYWVEDELFDRAAFWVGKIDADTSTSAAQGGATFEGAQFKIEYFDNTSGSVAGNAERTWTVRTNAAGKALLDNAHKVSGDEFYRSRQGEIVAPLGTYRITETKAPVGYLVNDDPVIAVVKSDTAGVVTGRYNKPDGSAPIVAEQPLRGGIEVVKRDSETGATAQGAATLAGAEFAIVSQNGKPVVVEGRSYAKGETVAVITTGADGVARTAEDALPYGDYMVHEVKPPAGYELDENWSESVQVRKKLVRVSIAMKDDVIEGGVEVYKTDFDRDASVPQGDATLAGAKIGIYNANSRAIRIGAKSYDDGALIRTVETSADGHAATGAYDLPYGTYLLKEIAPPHGYRLNAQWSETFSIREDGKMVSSKSGDIDELPDEVQRGDVTVPKIDHDLAEGTAQGDATLAGAEISIYNVSTKSVIVDGREVAPAKGSSRAQLLAAEPAAVIITNARGIAETSYGTLPYGRYIAIETKAPRGYLLNEAYAEKIIIEGDLVRVTAKAVADEVKRGGVEVRKLDSASLSITPQGDATLAGAVFGVRNASAAAVVVNGAEYAVGDEVTTIETDGEALAFTPATLLPYGSYELYEKEPPAGYLPDGEWKATVEVREQGVVVNGGDLAEDVIRGGITIGKIDAERDEAVAQGDATLAGAAVNIYNLSGRSVLVDGAWIEPAVGSTREELLASTPALTLTTGSSGHAASAPDALPYGRYAAIEIEPSRGYLLNESWLQLFSITDERQIVELDQLPEQVVRGDVMLGKVDAETGGYLPLGEGQLAGTEFTIVNISSGGGDSKVLVDGKLVETGEVAATIVTDKDGIARTEGGALAFGTYTYYESTAPYGYTDLPAGEGTFEIREDGVVVNGATGDAVELDENGAPAEAAAFVPAAANQVIRADMNLSKVEFSSQRGMAGIPFKITAVATGESHIIVTDANGIFDSAKFAPEMRDNANDAALIPTAMSAAYLDPETGETVESGVTYGESIDEELLDAAHGIWFAGRRDIENPQHEGLGAFPVGAYTLEELPCSANEGLRLIVRSFTVEEDGGFHGYRYDIGTLNNLEGPWIGTTLTSADGSSAVAADGSTELVDTVEYENLVRGEKYRLVGELHCFVESAEGTIDQIVAASETSFIARGSRGSAKVHFAFDASGVVGGSVVAFERLYDADGALVATHEDPEDEGQTVTLERVPEIGTVLAGEQGEKLLPLDEKIVLVDTVSYSGLEPGTTYRLAGELYDKSSGEALGVSAEIEFTPEASTGSALVRFEFDGSLIIGTRIVAFETLYENGREIAVHAELDDPDQTVTIPSIGTTLTTSDGYKTASGAAATLVDEIAYEGLVPGGAYVARGELHLTDGASDLGTIDGAAGEIAFVADASGAGIVEVAFELDAAAFSGQSVVAFEKVLSAGDGGEERIIAVHEDPANQGQTVAVDLPAIGTTLADASGAKLIEPVREVVLIDTIAYSGFAPGMLCTARGELHRFDAKGADLGVAAVAEKSFVVSDEGKGIVEVAFTIDASELQGSALVAFEEVGTLDAGGAFIVLATHADPSDAHQTVIVKTREPQTPEPERPKTPTPRKANAKLIPATGDTLVVGSLIGLAVAGVATLASSAAITHRYGRSNDAKKKRL